MVVASGGYAIIISDGNIRMVDFVAIFAFGALSGVLLTQIIGLMKNRQNAQAGQHK
ncbi:MAG: hypothetical protein H0X62_00665 [Bacteroidetes bacterium]|nr:hypothetical protein [Bacteroidota bacterium]